MAGYDLELAKLIRKAVSTPITMLGGAGTSTHMQELIDAVGLVGAAAGSMFVFKGPYRAVLINYARPSRLV
jgi:cyclase